MLELVPSNPLSETSPSRYSRPSGVILPVVKCAREVQLQAEKKARKYALESEYVVDYYVLDENVGYTDLPSYQAVQCVLKVIHIHFITHQLTSLLFFRIPMTEFKEQLLDQFVLEGEYSDEDDPNESDDSQNVRKKVYD